MTRAAEFTAELIRTTSRGLAGLSTARLFEKIEGAESRYGDDGFDSWRQALGARLEALASALEADDPSLFTEDMVWFRAVITSRDVGEEDVVVALNSMQETLAAQLPGAADSSIGRFFDAARESLAQPGPQARGLDPASRANELFELALLGDLSSARTTSSTGSGKARSPWRRPSSRSCSRPPGRRAAAGTWARWALPRST